VGNPNPINNSPQKPQAEPKRMKVNSYDIDSFINENTSGKKTLKQEREEKIAKAIEDAGFEIRDCIMWLYGSGFPKSMNISKKIATTKKFTELSKFQTELSNQWNGWGTCLKPAYEPIIVARKPFKGTLIENVIKNGVGGLNIDECRVKSNKISKNSGRFPSNVILTFEESDYDEVCSGFPNGKKNGSITKK